MEETFTATSAPYELPHPTDVNDFTVNLAALKELSQELAELFSLTLPEPFKKQAYKKLGIRSDQSRQIFRLAFRVTRCSHTLSSWHY